MYVPETEVLISIEIDVTPAASDPSSSTYNVHYVYYVFYKYYVHKLSLGHKLKSCNPVIFAT